MYKMLVSNSYPFQLRSQQGFTLLELLIVIAIAGILAMVATPLIRNMVVNNQSHSMAEQLVSALNVARVEAVTRGRRVALCPNDGASGCGDDWTQGMLVVIDSAVSDEANAVTVSNGVNDVLLMSSASSDGAKVDVSGGLSTEFIRFTREGLMAPGLSTTSPVTPMEFKVSIEGCTGRNEFGISVSRVGMVSSERNECSI